MNGLTIYWFLVAVPILDFKKKLFDTLTPIYGTIVHFIYSLFAIILCREQGKSERNLSDVGPVLLSRRGV